MREYVVTFDTKREEPYVTVLFAKDRKDAIDFAKRNVQARIWRDGWRVKGARLKKAERTHAHAG